LSLELVAGGTSTHVVVFVISIMVACTFEGERVIYLRIGDKGYAEVGVGVGKVRRG